MFVSPKKKFFLNEANIWLLIKRILMHKQNEQAFSKMVWKNVAFCFKTQQTTGLGF